MIKIPLFSQKRSPGQSGLSIFHRLLIYWLGSSIIVFALTAIIYTSNHRTITANTKQLALHDYSDLQRYLDIQTKDILVTDLEMLSSNPILDEYMVSRGVEANIQARHLERLFRTYLSKHQSYYGITFFNHSGVELIKVVREGREKKGSPSGSNKLFNDLESGLNGSLAVTEPYYGKSLYPLFSVGISKNDPDIGVFGGAIVIDYSLREIFSHLQQIEVLGNNPIWVFSPSGQVLLKPSSDNISLDPTPYLSIKTHTDHKDISFKTVPAGLVICQDFVILPDIKLIRIAMSVPNVLLQEAIRRTLEFLLIVFGLSLFFISITAFFISRRISRPIIELAGAAQQISLGDMTSKVNIQATGETRVLIDSFNHMATNLEKTLVSKTYLDNIINSIIDTLIVLTPEGKISQTNPSADALLDYEENELLGQPSSLIMEDPPQTDEYRAGEIIHNNGMHTESLYTSKTGRKIPVFFSVSSLQDNRGTYQGLICVAQDITELKRTEKRLQHAQKTEAIGLLAGGIAHDFNNFLAAILGNINLALFDDDLKDGTKKLLAEAEKASLRAKNLTQQLLTFSKGGDPVVEASSLENVIKDSANFILRGNRVACRYEFPEDLWLVDIDKGQMGQVIQNIVLNASHAMPEGGTIMVTCENIASLGGNIAPFLKDGRFVKICIQDSGIGIPTNLVEKIFDPYFSTKDGGSGLGLAITQSIISKHNGNITVESSPAKGTTFTIYIPASEKTEIQKQELLIDNMASSQAKILIMDDDEQVRTMISKMLIYLGHEVVAVADGEEALNMYMEAMNSDKEFDLIIMDLTIPGGMGGKEAVQEVLNIDPSAKVIVASGYSNDPIMSNYKDYGFRSAIAKPYGLQELSRVINQLIGDDA